MGMFIFLEMAEGPQIQTLTLAMLVVQRELIRCWKLQADE